MWGLAPRGPPNYAGTSQFSALCTCRGVAMSDTVIRSPTRLLAPTKQMTKPLIERYFVCIGAQKSGTTWLARVLSHHPDLFVTPVKEIHYFDHVLGVTQHLSDSKRRSRYRK